LLFYIKLLPLKIHPEVIEGAETIVCEKSLALISLFLFFLREGVENDARYHPNKTDKEGKMISLGWVGMAHSGEGFDDFP
jgi:hypothetical protein